MRMVRMSMRPVNEPKNYEIAIFDFDGTLLDTPHIYPFIHKELLRELGMSEDDIAYITDGYWQREVAGKEGHIDMPVYLSQRHGVDITPLEFRIRRQRIEEEYFTGVRQIDELRPLEEYIILPVVDDMKRLHAAGARCFIVSHNYGNVVECAMRVLGLDGLLEDCYTHCAYAELMHPRYDRSEPKKETFARLAKLASSPNQCVVYDDMDEHLRSAKELGMDSVKVDNEHAYPPPREHM